MDAIQKNLLEQVAELHEDVYKRQGLLRVEHRPSVKDLHLTAENSQRPRLGHLAAVNINGPHGPHPFQKIFPVLYHIPMKKGRETAAGLPSLDV